MVAGILSLALVVLLGMAGCKGECSREVSRKIRKLIWEEVFPTIGLKLSDLPSSCPLHPDLDMYAQQEKNKVELDHREWQCKYCQKRFVSEKYMDRHMDNKHANLIPVRIFVYCTIFAFASTQIIITHGSYF